MNELNNAHLQLRVPQFLKDELDNIAEHRKTSTPDLLRMWLQIMVEVYKQEEGFRTVHIQPEISLQSIKHYCERGDIKQLATEIDKRKTELRVMRDFQQNELVELDRISMGIVKMVTEYIDVASKSNTSQMG